MMMTEMENSEIDFIFHTTLITYSSGSISFSPSRKFRKKEKQRITSHLCDDLSRKTETK